MEHKEYRATVTFDDATGVFHGEVVDTRDVIVFEGTSAAQLRLLHLQNQNLRVARDPLLPPSHELGDRP